MAQPDFLNSYSAYQTEPTQERLTQVVQSLTPTIEFHLSQYGAQNDPVVRSKALVFTAGAIQKFDPSKGANLPTFLGNQLKQLNRVVRRSRSPVVIPERKQLESMKLNYAIRQFEDDYGREPDTLELADALGMPPKQIEGIRKYQVAVPSEEGVGVSSEELPDYLREAMEYVYHDADHTDRRVMELKLGMHGVSPMSANAVAAKLKLTPAQLSRRSSRISMKIQELSRILST